MKNSKKKQIFLTLVAVLSLVLITVGVSYSLFTYSKTGTTDNIIKTGKINFLYTEVSGIGKGISLTDAFPISDEEGKIQTGEGKVFDFKITSTIEMNSSISYEVTVRKKSDSTLEDDKVKLYLTEVNENEQEILLDKYSNLTQTSTKVPEGTVEKTIYEGEVSANTSNYEKNFRLRMWLDNDTDFSDGSVNSKTFTVTVNVYANGKVVTDNLDTTNTLDSITVSDCTLDPVFSETTTEYSCTVKNNISSVNVNATATSSKSKVRGLGAKDLTVGKNTLPIRVIAEDGSEKIYNVNVTRKAGATSLKNEIMKNKIITAEPTLTTSSNNTSDASGLYKSTATNTGEPTYYFRGNVENNYVSFAGQTWRIVRINEDGTVRVVMQDGINDNTTYAFNSNYNNYTYMYYSNSDAKTTLESWYQTNIGSKSDLAKNVASGNYYCEQAKAKYSDIYISGSSVMTTYNKYTPDFKCATDGNGKGLVNSNIGLLTYDDLIYAGNYVNQTNNNNYLNNGISYWTMSPSGVDTFDMHSDIWFIYDNSNIDCLYVDWSNEKYGVGKKYYVSLRPVINLKSDIQISSGDGTKENPFVVE